MDEEILIQKEILKLLIVDDHQMIRDGLKVMLATIDPLQHFRVTEAEGCAEAMKLIAKRVFDLVILDYQMPGLNGAETIYRMLRFNPDIKILLLSNYDELAYVQSCMEAGAKGYVLKNIEPAEMLRAIKTVLVGKIYYCNEVAIKLIDSGEDKKANELRINTLLTKREIEILRLIAMEHTNDEIAKQLFVSKRTVDTHRQNLIAKLHVKNTVGLVKAAYKMKLLEG